MFCFGPAIVADCGMGFTHTIVNQNLFAFKNIQSEMSSGFPEHSFTRCGRFFSSLSKRGVAEAVCFAA